MHAVHALLQAEWTARAAVDDSALGVLEFAGEQVGTVHAWTSGARQKVEKCHMRCRAVSSSPGALGPARPPWAA